MIREMTASRNCRVKALELPQPQFIGPKIFVMGFLMIAAPFFIPTSYQCDDIRFHPARIPTIFGLSSIINSRSNFSSLEVWGG